jgi:transposase InsO family protein
LEFHPKPRKVNNITQSISKKGECYDNAVAERFFNTLKTEFISQQTYATRAQAKSAIFHQTTVQILIPHKR